MKQALFIGAIASVLSINAFAETTTSTVTSKNYVDAQDALKQNKIPVTGTNSATPGTTVVTYTGTAGTIGERGIFNKDTDYDWDNHSVESGHEGDLVTAGDVMPELDHLSGVYQIDKYCEEYVANAAQTDENCLLWNIGDNIMGPYNLCQTDSDCDGCDGCINGLCKNDGRCDM